MSSFRSQLRPAVVWTALSVLLVPCGAAAPSNDDVRESLRRFTSIYETIENNFADKVDGDRAVYHGAIPGMLHTLDPHSNFLDPKAFRLLREDQTGRYYGVGMLIGALDGAITVMYPFEGSPAARAGLRPGDVILDVNDKSTEHATVPEVSGLLKGPKGTPASVRVRRSGASEPLYFHLTRDEVPRDSIRLAFWLKRGIAYVKIESFNEHTSKELDQHLRQLGERDIEGLVLDLRNNPGGILQEAVAVADRYLPRGSSIVTHHGRSSPESKFTAKRGERGREYPIVVLVNRSSASAAEIVAGALQDHDRAWILGENTFGKGLVQAPYRLSGDTGLLLTIARYYTPSGRLIQRDYTGHSFYEYYSRLQGQNNLKDLKKTDSGRLVYGGDGITPDEKFSEAPLNPVQATLLGNLTFFHYAAEYFGAHGRSLPRDWKPDARVLAGFQNLVRQRRILIPESAFQAERGWIADRLQEEMFVTAFGKEESERLALSRDPEVVHAIESLPKSRALLQKAHEIIARQTDGGTALER